VTDSEEQLRRWKGEMNERKRLGTGDLPMDLEMIESLKAGIPPAGGIALGLERLYMALFAVTDIRELTQFAP
jgi:elongation factor P--beta-lysine ligase